MVETLSRLWEIVRTGCLLNLDLSCVSGAPHVWDEQAEVCLGGEAESAGQKGFFQVFSSDVQWGNGRARTCFQWAAKSLPTITLD